MPVTSWGEPFDASYRLANREYVGCSSERTLQAAILPPGVGWINKVFGFATPCLSIIAQMAGYTSSIPFDYFVRAIGKSDVNYATTMQYPLVDSILNQEIICRALMLNCLTRDYAGLWADCWDDGFTDIEWAKQDPRLDPTSFTSLTDSWEWSTPLRTDFERRQALIELDVLVSMALGLTLEQLETVYRLDFSVLQSYENDTWYDRNGRIVFSKKSLGASKPSRQDFERAHAAQRDIEVTFTDDTLPGGPKERTIRYEAPFDGCDRIADYRQAWEFFSDKYDMGDER